MFRTFYALFLSLALACLLSACGNTGSLYLPEDPDQRQAQPSANDTLPPGPVSNAAEADTGETDEDDAEGSDESDNSPP